MPMDPDLIAFLEEENRETRRLFEVFAERIDASVRRVTEAVASLGERMDERDRRIREDLGARNDRAIAAVSDEERVRRLEAGR